MSVYKPVNCLICGKKIDDNSLSSDNFIYYTDEDVIEQSENYKKIRVPCTVMYVMDNKVVLDNQSNKGGFYSVEDVQHDFSVEPPKTILTLRR